MELNYEQLFSEMLNAAKSVLNKHWKNAKPFAEKHFKSLTENIQLIAELKLRNEITEEQAKLQIDVQKDAIQMVLLTIEGLSILAVEAAINAAIDVVKGTVNTAIGWTIL